MESNQTIESLKEELAIAHEEIYRLKSAMVDDMLKQTVIKELSIDAKKGILALQGGPCSILANSFEDFLYDAPNTVENYIEATFHSSRGNEQIIVTVQRGSGKSPHQLRKEADAKVKELSSSVLLHKDSAPKDGREFIAARKYTHNDGDITVEFDFLRFDTESKEKEWKDQVSNGFYCDWFGWMDIPKIDDIELCQDRCHRIKESEEV